MELVIGNSIPPSDSTLGGNVDTSSNESPLNENGGEGGVNWGEAIVGAGLIFFGGHVGVGAGIATLEARGSLELDFTPLFALVSAAGFGFAAVGIYLVIDSGIVPGTKRKP